jgi:hypothetical protein
MKEQLILFGTAKLAKEKRFDCKVGNFFKLTTISHPLIEDTCLLQNINSLSDVPLFSRPTQSLLQKWLREVHNIDVSVNPINDCTVYKDGIKKYCWDIYNTEFEGIDADTLSSIKIGMETIM